MDNRDKCCSNDIVDLSSKFLVQLYWLHIYSKLLIASESIVRLVNNQSDKGATKSAVLGMGIH